MYNKAIIMGRLTADPELRQTPSNISVTSFTVACDRAYSKGADRQTDFIDCVAWRGTAEFVCRYFQKGKPILVEGRLQVTNYTDKNGEKRRRYEVVADNVHFVDGSKNSNPGDSGNVFSAPAASDVNTGVVEKMGISHIKTQLPSQCSGGEQQRCAIARAVINSPKLLFADEPTGALNRKNTTEVLNLLTDLNTGGQSILMVTHDARAALRATRIIYIADGAVIGDIELPPYTAEAEKSRETQVNAWLASMEW